MNNLLSYCGLVDAKIRASDKDLPVPKNSLGFLIGKHPYFNFLPGNFRAMSIYNFLLLRPCTLVVLQRSQKRFGFFINSLKALSKFWVGKKICDDPIISKLKITYFGQEVQGMTLGLCHGNANDKQSHISHIRHLDGLSPP
jgi:hypothetical protein